MYVQRTTASVTSGWGSTEVWDGPNPGKNTLRKSVWKNPLAVKSAGTFSDAGGVAKNTDVELGLALELDVRALDVCFKVPAAVAAAGAVTAARTEAARVTVSTIRQIADIGDMLHGTRANCYIYIPLFEARSTFFQVPYGIGCNPLPSTHKTSHRPLSMTASTRSRSIQELFPNSPSSDPHVPSRSSPGPVVNAASV